VRTQQSKSLIVACHGFIRNHLGNVELG
jgi:hypothetical protein